MDGVLVDVSESYREAIVATVQLFTGRRVSRELIQDYKNQGGWNNDWALSQKIAADLGFQIPYERVVDEFNRLFLGNGDRDGLIYRERWIAGEGLLESLCERFRLAIFTGRSRQELVVTMGRFASKLGFDPVLCADDIINAKPAPDGLLRIAESAPASERWYVGDTVDDARCARAAGYRFIGIAAPASPRCTELARLLHAEGAAAILDDINQLPTVL
jgi:HAD superfamily hydrolase (TIGR01548 family)